jgi:cytochrome P450 family 142 subfamily A polypeptide 1
MQIDLLDGDFYANGPYEQYAWLRENAPLYWDETNELWGVSRYDDIIEIEKRKDVFINSDQEKGGYRPNIPADAAIIGLDDPMHHKRRNLVSRRFTPKAVTAWQDDIRSKVTALLDAVEAKGGEAEVIVDLAAPLPAMMIGKLLGFGEARWPELQRWSEETIAMGGGPRYFNETGMLAAMEFAQAAADQFEAKRAQPADDILTLYTTAEIDGCPMTQEHAIADSLLLLDGGAETTRTVIARTLLNLIAHPGEWEKLKSGADLTVATEEFIRYVTPIHNMCRVATEDAEVAGGVVPKGHQVVLMYSSANRDPKHFDDPERFDVTRQPNNHIAFGFGTHFCLGTALARLEILTFFQEFVRRVESFRITPGTEPVEMPNAFVYGLKSANLDIQFAK